MDALGMPQVGGYSKGEWKQLTKDRMAGARTACLAHMVAEARKDGPQRSDEAYMQGVAPAGQVGHGARIVSAVGNRVKYRYYRRFQRGLLDAYGAVQMMTRRTHKFDSAKGDLPHMWCPGDRGPCPDALSQD